jgi:hypothetical protein
MRAYDFAKASHGGFRLCFHSKQGNNVQKKEWRIGYGQGKRPKIN